MTERSTSIPTQIATPIQGAFRSSISLPNDAIPPVEFIDEEPYTIKCICEFEDDDGNTIYCERCDTWQHIECYYPGRVEDASKEEFDHSCANCHPRVLDHQNATERQRRHRQNKVFGSPEDKKAKRPPSKSHKKKVKPSEVQVNGYHEHDRLKNGSPHDGHSTAIKKPKGHRASQSMSSKRSPPLHARPHNNAHPPSPAQTPPDLPTNFQVHSYSDNFITLYDDDQQLQSTKTNSSASLAVSNAMSSWLRDPAKLLAEVGVANRDDVIQTLTVSLDSLDWPELRVEQHQAKFNDTIIQWRSLVNCTDLHVAGRIGEINGIVGYQKDYCNDATNRWPEYIHPRPFIFFPSRLPLFIDARKEGSPCRYVRRSCRPNSCLETFVIHDSEYHFWLVSERPLSANEQVTLPWEFVFPPNTRFLKLLNLGDGEDPSRYPTDITDEEYNQLASTLDLVLSDYGGCACGLGNDCAFARFHRNYHGRAAHNQSNGVKSKKGRKPKQNHVSPTSTGHATNSRAASEGQDQYDEDDSRSQSDSVKSKPHSRDLTPLHGVGESNGIFTEPSDREKRKLAMLEDSFRKMEQQQPVRKKTKRASDTSTANLPNGTPQPKGRKGSAAPRGSITQPLVPNSSGPKSRYVDASTSGRQSGSPFSAAISPFDTANSPNSHVSPRNQVVNGSRDTPVVTRGVYVTAATQTDPVADAWWDSKPKPKRCIVPLAKKLMQNRHKIQRRIDSQVGPVQQAGEQQQSGELSLAQPMELDQANTEDRPIMESPPDSKVRRGSVSSIPPADVPPDVTMTDAPPTMAGNPLKPPPPTWRGPSAVSPGQRPVDLRVQMPAVPTFTTPNMGGLPSGSVTPASAPAQSPFGTVTFPPNVYPQMLNGTTTPSPAKTTKKLSLSEYKSRMKTSAANKPSSGSSPTVPPAVLKLASQDVKAPGVLEGSAIIESPLPTPEKAADPLAVAGADTKLY